MNTSKRLTPEQMAVISKKLEDAGEDGDCGCTPEELDQHFEQLNEEIAEATGFTGDDLLTAHFAPERLIKQVFGPQKPE